MGEVGETVSQAQTKIVVGAAYVAKIQDLGAGREGRQEGEAKDRELLAMLSFPWVESEETLAE